MPFAGADSFKIKKKNRRIGSNAKKLIFRYYKQTLAFLTFFVAKKVDFFVKLFVFCKRMFNFVTKLKNPKQCVLLDKDNKVLMIGNPTMNTGIWQLFKGYISERNNINQKKKEESLAFINKTTLPPDFPSY